MSVSQLAWLKHSCSALISSNGRHDYWEKAGLYYQELRAMVVNKDLVGGVIKLIRYTSFSFTDQQEARNKPAIRPGWFHDVSDARHDCYRGLYIFIYVKHRKT